jgi:hypothetical protein
MAQHATTEEVVFSVDPTDVPIDWLDSDHVIYCVYCKSMSVPRLYKEVTKFVQGSCELRVAAAAEARKQASKSVLGRRQPREVRS